MTVKECIDKVDNLYPNQYSEEIKVDWLSRLDNQIFNDIILSHEPPFPVPRMPIPNPIDQTEDDAEDIPKPPFPPIPEFKPYTMDNETVRLIAPFPYDELYIFYLQMKIDEANKESVQYNNDAMLFNSYYENFAKYYNKIHMPINRARYNMWRH